MKTCQLFSMGVALVCVCGCAPELAHSQNGQEEDLWQKSIQRSYPDNRGPQVAPNAIVDHYSPKMVEAEAAAPAPAADEAIPVAAETAAPAAVPAAPVAAPPPVIPAPAAPAAEPAAAPAPAVAPAEKAEVPAEASASAEKPATPAAPAETAVPAAGDQFYVVQGGDTLGGIARKFYGDARRYDIILKANSSVVKTPQGLRPGMKLVIPQL